jgi:hypothetical protein
MNEQSPTHGVEVVTVFGEAHFNASPENVRRPQRFWRVRVTVTTAGTLGNLANHFYRKENGEVNKK